MTQQGREGGLRECFVRVDLKNGISVFFRNFSNNRINTIPDGTFNNLHALKKM